MAGSAFGGTIISIVSFGVFSYLSTITSQTAQEAINLTRDQLAEAKYEQRAWVKESALAVVDQARLKDDEFTARIEYRIENVGHTPAFHTRFTAESVVKWRVEPPGQVIDTSTPYQDNLAEAALKAFGKVDLSDLDKAYALSGNSRLDALCDMQRSVQGQTDREQEATKAAHGNKNVAGIFESGPAVFPSDEMGENFEVKASVPDRVIKISRGGNPMPIGNSFVVAVTTCVEYRTGDPKDIHRTGSIYLVGGVDPQNLSQIVSLAPTKDPIPATALRTRLVARYAD